MDQPQSSAQGDSRLQEQEMFCQGLRHPGLKNTPGGCRVHNREDRLGDGSKLQRNHDSSLGRWISLIGIEIAHTSRGEREAVPPAEKRVASTTSPKFVPGLRVAGGVKRGFVLK